MPLEKLWHGDSPRVGVTQSVAESIEAGGGGVCTEHEGEAGRRTDGLVAEGQFEAQSAGRQFVEMRGAGVGIAVTPEGRFEVIDQ